MDDRELRIEHVPVSHVPALWPEPPWTLDIEGERLSGDLCPLHEACLVVTHPDFWKDSHV